MPSSPAIPFGAFKELMFTLLFKALEVSTEMGLLTSVVLSTKPKFKVLLSMTTFPVNVFTEVTDDVGMIGLFIISL